MNPAPPVIRQVQGVGVFMNVEWGGTVAGKVQGATHNKQAGMTRANSPALSLLFLRAGPAVKAPDGRDAFAPFDIPLCPFLSESICVDRG